MGYFQKPIAIFWKDKVVQMNQFYLTNYFYVFTFKKLF